MSPENDCHQLRYYIALSAPPTRSPATGDEPFMRAEPGFNPSWFHKYCGIDFSERWHSDVEYRLESYNKMADEVRKRFPGKNIGGINDDEPADLITGLYGCAVVPALFQGSITYFPDKWPQPNAEHLTDTQADNLKVPDFDNNPLWNDIFSQIDKIQKLTGKARGFLNWQGVINIAFRLRGQQIFIDLFDNPARANHMFEVISDTLIEGIKRLLARQKQANTNYRFATISNCVVNMISPQQYEQFLLPYDLKIREQFEVFGIHNCAWIVDPYMDAYTNVPDLGYLDMGITSDLKRAKKLFPDTRRNILYTSMDLAAKTDRQIREDFEKIAAELAPCDVGLPDIEIDVPDERPVM